MADSNWLDIITTVSNLMAAGGGLYAAYAASQSAKVAYAAMTLAKQTESRALRRQLAHVSGEILSESQRVMEVAQQLKVEQSMLRKSSGMSSSTSETLAIENISDRITIVDQITNEAQQLVHQFNSLATASEEDIANALARLENYLIQVRNQRFALDQDIKDVTSAKQVALTQRSRIEGN